MGLDSPDQIIIPTNQFYTLFIILVGHHFACCIVLSANSYGLNWVQTVRYCCYRLQVTLCSSQGWEGGTLYISEYGDVWAL